MRDYVRTLEMEGRTKKENSDMVIERLKEITSHTLKLPGQDMMSWEKTLIRTLTSSANEQINFMKAVQGQRVLFMPRSEGIYIALILKQVQDIDTDQLETSPLKARDMNSTGLLSQSSSTSVSSSVAAVKKQIIKNNLFLDISSLSKNLQLILT